MRIDADHAHIACIVVDLTGWVEIPLEFGRYRWGARSGTGGALVGEGQEKAARVRGR